MDLLNFLLQEQNLQIMERGLLLLKSHIESFKRRFVKQSGRCCFCSFNVSNWKLKTLWVIIFLECLSDRQIIFLGPLQYSFLYDAFKKTTELTVKTNRTA